MKKTASLTSSSTCAIAALGVLALGTASSRGQLDAGIQSVEKSGGIVDITMSIQDLSRLNPAVPPSGINGLILQQSLDLLYWTTVHPDFVSIDPPTGLTPPTNGRWTASLFSPAGSQFYRFLGVVTTPEDADGDGLFDTFETNVFPFTDARLFDSDLDTFSDGQEFAYGTDANNSSSKPVSIDLPTVEFAKPNSTAAEGISPHWLEIVFDRPFSGVVNYAVDPLGNTIAGTDFTLGGIPTAMSDSIYVNGTSASIPITISDDAVVSGQRAIIINLSLNGNTYFLGGWASHVLLLEDNDAWWTGALIPASGEISSRMFRLNVIHQGSSSGAVFGAGAGNDGLALPNVEHGGGAPAIGDTSISVSMIPWGQWPASGVVATETQFHAESPLVSVAGGSLFAGETISRQLALNAQPSLNSDTNPHLLEDVRIVGDYTETLTNSVGDPITTLFGTFILVRDIPVPLPVLSGLVPASP